MTQTHLRTEELMVQRGGRRVLHGVSAAFPRRIVTVVVGPSGAGKTSLLRSLNRLEEPSAGRVLLDEIDIRQLDPRRLRRRVGMVFQSPVLFPHTVRDNLAYNLGDHDEAVLLRALEAAQLPPGFLERETGALSVGEAQRVTIARALVRDPEVLLLDEPTSALDEKAGAGIEALVRQLTVDRGLTVVVVTHDLDQAARLGDEALLVVDGRVQAVGRPDNLRTTWQRVVR